MHVMNKLMLKSLVRSAIAMSALCVGAKLAEAATFIQTDLVSDIPGLAAITDPNLTNTWGVSHLPGSPFWISNQATGTASLYTVTGSTGVAAANLFPAPAMNFVAIPPGSGPGVGPTGQVANSGALFGINGGPALFIFANLNGTISAWNISNVNSATHNAATVEATTPGASYTGLAINQANSMLYAANGKTGAIDVFNSSFAPVSLGSSAFATPAAIKSAGLVPFNVQDINGSVYVTYAPPGHTAQAGAALGQGAVAVFNESGLLQKPPLIGGNLASPWGVTLAPASFGKFGGDLLVGNFSFFNSEINAFNPVTDAFEGSISINDGPHNAPGGLWSMLFGSGGSGSPNTLYFTDGINNENAGLFGAITSVPEPSTWVMMLLGFGGLGFAAFRTKKGAKAAVTD
jgi:uncharacterized protein (TIGR03118 family)